MKIELNNVPVYDYDKFLNACSAADNLNYDYTIYYNSGESLAHEDNRSLLTIFLDDNDNNISKICYILPEDFTKEYVIDEAENNIYEELLLDSDIDIDEIDTNVISYKEYAKKYKNKLNIDFSLLNMNDINDLKDFREFLIKNGFDNMENLSDEKRILIIKIVNMEDIYKDIENFLKKRRIK